MSRSEPALGNLNVERFAKVCKATRSNVRTALDLIFIHAEKEVRGRQPRASLNPLTILSAAAAYERFFNDLYAAAKDPASVSQRPRRVGAGPFQDRDQQSLAPGDACNGAPEREIRR
jgi:hypothetical protein